MTSLRIRLLLLAAGLLMFTAFTTAAVPGGMVAVQILAVNDFHGHLPPPSGSIGAVADIEAGGAEYLATHIDTLRALNPNTVVVSAGDLIGASPLPSALFHDEPTIEAFNLIGLDFNAVGNHEFDEGARELMRMQRGGCHPVDGCVGGGEFQGAKFPFLAANVRWKKTNASLFPSYETRSFDGVEIAFIGMTLKDTPSVVMPSGVAELRFLDEADTVNALIPELKRKGIETIVVLIHEGGVPAVFNYNGCIGISGPIVDIVTRLDDAVDVVISGHTHQAYNCTINGKIVTSAYSYGRIVSKIDLLIDRDSKDVLSKMADNRIVTRDVPKDQRLTALIDKYYAVAKPLANRAVGSVAADITSAVNPAGESALGDVVADAQLAATRDLGSGGAVLSLANPGSIRADLTFKQTNGNESPGQITYGELFNVQPFGNNLVTMTLTGAQIKSVLEQQFDNPTAAQNRILQVSEGFSYAWSRSASLGNKVSKIWLNEKPLDMHADYRVTVNAFLADGGDNFSAFVQGAHRRGGIDDIDALEKYVANFSPLKSGPQDRISVLP
jgi:5'-nucleotidase